MINLGVVKNVCKNIASVYKKNDGETFHNVSPILFLIGISP